MARFVVDTHALLWFLAGDPSLGPVATAAMSDPESQLVLPAIALAEALWIIAARKIGLTSAELLTAIDSDQRIEVFSLTREVVELASTLSDIGEMHDRQIVATGIFLNKRGEEWTLLTKDENISKSGVVKVAW